MGGNALAHLGVGRASTEVVINLFNRVYRLMVIQGMTPSLVPWVESKKDHGDIDVLVVCKPDDIRQFFGNVFVLPSDQMSTNGDVVSVCVPYDDTLKIQMDFICITGNVTFQPFYYAGGDLGSLVGRIAAANGFTFASDGLRLRADHEKGIHSDIPLPIRIGTALDLLGLTLPSPNTFKTYENMWNYVLSSKMAHPAMFTPDATNSENRRRDLARQSINNFQVWVNATFPESVNGTFERIGGAERISMLPEFLQRYVNGVMAQRERDGEDFALRSACYGRAAVEAVFGILDTETIGQVIRGMQLLLPNKEERLDLWANNKKTAKLLSEAAARAAGLELALKPKAKV